MHLKVSIITVTRNSEKTLQRTIDSVVSQNYNQIEHILVDGNSTDGTKDIIKNNPSISIVISESDKGIYDAINKGIKLASGDVIGILNSDDVLAADDVISTIVDCIQSNGNDVVYGDLMYVSTRRSEKSIRQWKSNDFNAASLKKGWMAPHPTLYCKKSVYDTFGLYDDRLRISSDYDFILRIFQIKTLKTEYIPKVMVKMCWGGESNRSLSNIVQKSREDLRVIRKNNIGGVPTLILKNIRKLKQFL